MHVKIIEPPPVCRYGVRRRQVVAELNAATESGNRGFARTLQIELEALDRRGGPLVPRMQYIEIRLLDDRTVIRAVCLKCGVQLYPDAAMTHAKKSGPRACKPPKE